MCSGINAYFRQNAKYKSFNVHKVRNLRALFKLFKCIVLYIGCSGPVIEGLNKITMYAVDYLITGPEQESNHFCGIILAQYRVSAITQLNLYNLLYFQK